ncbi:hypothetical protein M569_03899 [Genlisea aurea]|uniref:NAC domain-containing protein n=1 Tax=Genlisea aurea TaxID=192259 RepID=S8E533_9LAMI|nr:hypothetical protein M569_03899 [Genlisea aurea]
MMMCPLRGRHPRGDIRIGSLVAVSQFSLLAHRSGTTSVGSCCLLLQCSSDHGVGVIAEVSKSPNSSPGTCPPSLEKVSQRDAEQEGRQPIPVTGKRPVRRGSFRSGSAIIGTERSLVFHSGRAPGGHRTEWIMNE